MTYIESLRAGIETLAKEREKRVSRLVRMINSGRPGEARSKRIRHVSRKILRYVNQENQLQRAMNEEAQRIAYEAAS